MLYACGSLRVLHWHTHFVNVNFTLDSVCHLWLALGAWIYHMMQPVSTPVACEYYPCFFLRFGVACVRLGGRGLALEELLL